MAYIDLIEKLTDEDKKILNLYINDFGCNIDNFVGLDNWLQNWSHSKQKLYHLLGDSFIKEYPYEYEKSKEDLEREIKELFSTNHIKSNYHDFYFGYIKNQEWLENNKEALTFLNHLFDYQHFIYEKIDFSLKIKKPNGRKMLQIQAGIKPIKAIGRVIDYFKDDYKFDLDAFEEFKKRYGIIMSEKVIKGKFCISIHPMDFITMSDNASRWSSCMSWTDEGCYHIGTVEMMNSNNVVCAYLLHGTTNYVFNTDITNSDTGELIGVWNNKRWRQLFYITKDIIMSGKPYPYISEELSKTILAQIKELASNNLNWDYKFGPELYQDMVHVNSLWNMNNQRNWMHYEKKKPFKHNIIWDTKGMYNDMLNDSNTKYWCYRNKVNHTKIISVSGKASCLCCSNQVITTNYDTDEYNDRYEDTGNVICFSCLKNKFQCDGCNRISSKTKLYLLKNGQKVCKNCLNNIKICPHCGEWFIANEEETVLNNYVYNNHWYDRLNKGEVLPKYRGYRSIWDYNGRSKEEIDKELNQTEVIDSIETENLKQKTIFYLEQYTAIHSKCKKQIYNIFNENCIVISFPRLWSSKPDYFNLVDPAVGEKYRTINLQKPDLADVLEVGTELTT